VVAATSIAQVDRGALSDVAAELLGRRRGFGGAYQGDRTSRRLHARASLAVVLEIYRRKLEAPRRLRMVYHHGRDLLGHVRVDQAFQRTTCRSSLSLKEHTHEWYSTLAVEVDLQVVNEEKRIAVICEVPASDATSSWNKVVGGGDPMFLSALGIPVTELYDLPLAHVKAGWSIDPATSCLRWVRTARLKPGDATFDVVGFSCGCSRKASCRWRARTTFAGSSSLSRSACSVPTPPV
jgi:hypothetical protein